MICLIRAKLRPDADVPAYEALNARMEELVRAMPGFIGVNGYASPDGDEFGLVRFETREALRAWREHPEHLAAQQRGRTEFYASLAIEVCEVIRAYEFTHSP